MNTKIAEDKKKKDNNVEILLGEPKKALVKLAMPMIMASLAHALFQLTDILWVAGLGADSISAVGFFSPLLLLSAAFISGIGVGGGTRISQRIGADDKNGAGIVASQLFTLIIVASIIIIGLIYWFETTIFTALGAKNILDLALSYSRIMLLSFFFQFLLEGAATIFRSEGDAKRAMNLYLVTIVLNVVLDPIFIYGLDLGVAGAAWASVVSLLLATVLWVYWIIIKKSTYIAVNIKLLKLDTNAKAILQLGVPVALSQVFAALMIVINTRLVAEVGGTDGVAIYQVGLRFWNLTLLPLFGVANAMTTIVGAAWGANDISKIHVVFRYALKVTLVSQGILSIFIFVAAPQLAFMYSWAEESENFKSNFEVFFMVFATINLSAVFVFLVENLMVGIGEATKKLYLSLVRGFLFVVPFTILFGVILEYGLLGVWVGISIGNWLGALLAGIVYFKYFNDRKVSPAVQG